MYTVKKCLLDSLSVLSEVDTALRASGFTGKEKRFRELPR